MTKTSLFDGFEEVTAKAWKQKIQFDLKGADYNDTLLWESPEGIVVKPFYNAEDFDGQVGIPAKKKEGWRIGQHIYCGDAEKSNAKALNVLDRGAESLVFRIPSETCDIAALLKDIDLLKTPFHFYFDFLSLDFINKILKTVGRSASEVYLHLDPIGQLARSGNWFVNANQDLATLKEIVQQNSLLDNVDCISVDVSLYQNAGANMVQQLAYAMAHANEYLNALDSGLGNSKALPKFSFKMAVGSNYFFEIAKIRAFRILWDSLSASYGGDGSCHILAVPSRRNKTLYDYNTNMLRTTTECMSAILGGADTVYNLAYDCLYHKDNEFGERLARNQLLILKEESYFDKVGNPADGAYYIENITTQLAKKALELFKSIEKAGGLLKQLKDHTIQRKIKESAHKEQLLFDGQTEVLIGTNKYQNAADKMKGDLELYPFLKTNPTKTFIEPILAKRLSEEIEQKRLDDE